MAEEIDRTAVLGLEEARLWPPPHVLDDPCESKVYLQSQQCRRQPPEKLPQPGWKLRHKTEFPAKPARGGPGMQAVFLDSDQRSCGTGFFLPRRAGGDYQLTRKTGCSPLLLPCRVVQALNLDVHSLGSPLSPQGGVSEKNINGIAELAGKENLDEITSENRSQRANVCSKSRSTSPEIFLPKEWSY